MIDRGRQSNSRLQKKLTTTYLVVAAVLFALIVYVLVIMQQNREDYQKTILTQQGYNSTNLAFCRGSITDRNGTVLAYSEEVYNLILDPTVILYTAKASDPEPNRNATVNALAEVFGFDRDELNTLLTEKKNSAYVRYARALSADDMNAFLNYQTNYNTAKDALGKKQHSDKVTGVWFETEYQRTYPYKKLACTVLGFSGADADEGHWGLEEYYNDSLSGTPGKLYSYINAEGDYETMTEAPRAGYTVASTVDYNIQTVVEDRVQEFIRDNVYTDVGVIVMDPGNGEILAMATDKSYDPNDPTDLSGLYSENEIANMTSEEKSAILSKVWRNFTVNDAYTPGSVSKELTVAMALEEHVVDEDTQFECDGGETVAGTHIKCNSTHGIIDLAGGLMYSCNDAMMNIASRLNVAAMLKWQRIFGLGSRTGIDLPGEATGLLFDEASMSPVDMATSSFGQGYSSTMIQMAAAYCSIINGGYYYQPHIVRQLLDENGGVVKTVEPVLVRSTVTENTCAFLKKAALDTVDTGSGQYGKIPGYSVGGKTGTAQKYPLESQLYVVSFMAFAPAENPEVLVYVVINEPEHEGTEVSNLGAVLMEQSIMSAILPYLGVAKNTP